MRTHVVLAGDVVRLLFPAVRLQRLEVPCLSAHHITVTCHQFRHSAHQGGILASNALVSDCRGGKGNGT